MKVKIKDLKPNPYRDMENYPINPDKILRLSESITQTGFWDNVIARQVNGEIQIAYGHHRLEALKHVAKILGIEEIEVPIKPLTDALMIQIMANENDNEWQTCVAVTDETVRVADKYLKEHPEEIKIESPKKDNTFPTGRENEGYHNTPWAFQLAVFLNWPEDKVYESLKRISMIKDKDLPLDKKVIEGMPNEKAAARFVMYVKRYELSISEQKSVFKILKETDSWGDRAMKDAIFYIQVESKVKKEELYPEGKVLEFEDFIQEVIARADSFSDGIKELTKFRDEFDSIFYRNMIKKYILITTLDRIKNQIINFFNTYENENINEKTTKQLQA